MKIKYQADDETLFNSAEECDQYEEEQEIIAAINAELQDFLYDELDWHDSTKLLAKTCPFTLKKYVDYLIIESAKNDNT